MLISFRRIATGAIVTAIVSAPGVLAAAAEAGYRGPG